MKKRTVIKIKKWTLLVTTGIMLILISSVVVVKGDFIINSVSTPNVLDGVKGTEWDDANSTTVTLDLIAGNGLPNISVTLYAYVDLTTLYMAFEYDDGTLLINDWMAILFDIEEDNDWDYGPSGADYFDTVIAMHQSSWLFDDQYCYQEMFTPDIQYDVQGNGTVTGEGYFIEFSHPLNSGDTASYDISLQDGDTIQFKLLGNDENGTHWGLYTMVNPANLTIAPGTIIEFTDFNNLLPFVSFIVIIAIMYTRRKH